MAPPASGPRRYEIAKTDETKLVYLANLAGGTSSKNMIMAIEYVPEPPMPCKARHVILYCSENNQTEQFLGINVQLHYILSGTTSPRECNEQKE